MIKLFIWGPITFIFSVPTLAQQRPAPGLDSCSAQVELFCKDEKVPGKTIKCLLAHESDLSPNCMQEIQRAARTVEQSGEQGGGTLAALSSLSPPFPVLSYEGRFSPGSTTYSENKLKLSAPLYQTETDYLSLSVVGAQVGLGNAVRLTPMTEVPSQLQRAEIGAEYSQKRPGFKKWGVRGSVGYAGDELFKNAQDTTFSFNVNYGYPSKTGGYWTWMFFISNNGPFGNYIPIPGVMYFYKTPTFTGLIGFPVLSLQWTPVENWAYSLSAFGTSVTAEAAHGSPHAIQFFSSAAWTNQNFILSKRVQTKDRLTIEEKKASLGLRTFVWGKTQLDGQAGYAFDRLLYVGQGIRNMEQGSAELKADWFMSWSLKTTF